MITNKVNFRIVSTGSAYGDYNPGNFLHAFMINVLNEQTNILIRFVGDCSEWAYNFLCRHYNSKSWEKYFAFEGYVNHNRSINFIQNAELLLLYLPCSTAYILPGKLFEYIRTGVPILALVPLHGDAAQIIRTTRTGFVVDPDDIENIGKTVNQLYHQWQNGGLKLCPNMDEINKYSRDVLTDQLIDVFKEVMKKV